MCVSCLLRPSCISCSYPSSGTPPSPACSDFCQPLIGRYKAEKEWRETAAHPFCTDLSSTSLSPLPPILLSALLISYLFFFQGHSVPLAANFSVHISKRSLRILFLHLVRDGEEERGREEWRERGREGRRKRGRGREWGRGREGWREKERREKYWRIYLCSNYNWPLSSY